MGFENGWCPCDKLTCGKMWDDIKTLTIEASMPFNLSLVSIYKTYIGTYLLGGKEYTPQINETLKVSYAAHCIYLMLGFFTTPFLRKIAPHAKGPEGGQLGEYNVYDILNICTYLHTWCFLSFLWALTVVKYPGKCCMKPVRAAFFFGVWMFIAILFDSVSTYLHLFLFKTYEWFFIFPAIIQIVDILVLIPITHWSFHAFSLTTYKGIEMTAEEMAEEGVPLKDEGDSSAEK